MKGGDLNKNVKKYSLVGQILVITVAVIVVGWKLGDVLTELGRPDSNAMQEVTDNIVEQQLEAVLSETDQQTLEVRPALGDPEPIDYQLQGAADSASTQSTGSQSLQKPSANPLQPNAGVAEIPE